MTLPAYVQIEPVGQCNLRCRMCPIQLRGDWAREQLDSTNPPEVCRSCALYSGTLAGTFSLRP